jgi:hypothetical protein
MEEKCSVFNEICAVQFCSHDIVVYIDLLLGNNHETMAIAREQLHKYAAVLEPLLGSGPHARLEVLLEAVFSKGPFQGYITQPTKLR